MTAARTVSGVRIRAVAGSLPRSVVDVVRDLSELGAEDDLRRLVLNTGISSFHQVAPGQTSSDLAFEAGKRLLEMEGVSPDEVDALVFVTQTPDFLLPASGALLQHRLRLRQDVVTYDVNSGCAGFVQGLLLAAGLISGAGFRKVLLLTADTTTRLIHPEDRALRVLFGDGGAAVLLELSDASERISFVMGTDGGGAEALIVRDGMFRGTEAAPNLSACHLHMDGIAVMNFALREVPASVGRVLDKQGWTSDYISHFVLHQANALMLEVLRRKLRLERDRVPVVMQRIGNTGPASIPLALMAIDGMLGPSVLLGFGVGLMWGAVAVDLSQLQRHGIELV